MIKLIVAVRKRADMSVEDFQEHWKTRHAQLVKDNPATERYVRKYVQCHTMPEQYEQGGLRVAGFVCAFDPGRQQWTLPSRHRSMPQRGTGQA